MSSTASRFHALCCVCGNLRTVGSRNYGHNVQSVVFVPHDAESLAEMQARGWALEVEAYWRFLNTFRCTACKAWTRHALASDVSETDIREESEPIVDPLAGRDPLEALREWGITVAWANNMEWVSLWLLNERVMILNTEQSRADLAADVTAFLNSEELAD